jgi:hypothetical protein
LGTHPEIILFYRAFPVISAFFHQKRAFQAFYPADSGFRGADGMSPEYPPVFDSGLK